MSEESKIERHTNVIPCPPGYAVLDYDYCTLVLRKYPIVGWTVITDRHEGETEDNMPSCWNSPPLPITPGSPRNSHAMNDLWTAIEYPDGYVIDGDGSWYSSSGEYHAKVKREAVA